MSKEIDDYQPESIIEQNDEDNLENEEEDFDFNKEIEEDYPEMYDGDGNDDVIN